MSKFYFLLWLHWAFRLSISTFIYGSFFAILITLFLYIKQGLPTLTAEVYTALFDIWSFWFLILGNIALLLALFRGMKYIFNTCHNSYVLELFSCENEESKELIESVGYGDLVKVWRKWFMLLIWITGAQMVIALALSAIFISNESIFTWFNIYSLYGFILVAGYLSFIIFSAKCKRVRIKKC